MRVGLCIPTFNGQHELEQSLPALRPARPLFSRMLGIDSSSSDDSVRLLEEAGFEVRVIPAEDFDHGGTRQLAVEMMPECDIVVFLTQDAAIVRAESIEKLLQAFDDPDVVVAYGRQLPRIGANAIEAHARLFSYPSSSIIKTKELIPKIGLRTAVVSNSFAAYRRSQLVDLGGFPKGTLFAEDTLVGAKVILSGRKVAYVGDAEVYHSHKYSMVQEFRRYFDNGAFYSREQWILDAFGKAEGSGKAFVISELKFLSRKAPWLIVDSLGRTVIKYLGYKTGSLERFISNRWKVYLSMNRKFWERAGN